jgi:hypothetical protein
MQWMGAGCYEVFQSPEKPYLVEYFNLLLKGKADAAMEIYWKIAPMRNIFEQQFNQTVMSGTYNWHQQKFYQWCTGGNGGVTRQPAMKLHQWEADPIKMGYFLIDITPPENDEEFYIGKMNYARIKAAEGEMVTSKPASPVVVDSTTQGGSDSLPERALRLSQEFQRILIETEAEMKRIPAMIRPIIKSGFKKKTGGSLQDWAQTAEALTQALGGGAPDTGVDAALKESLGRLATYYRETPKESARFVKDEAGLQALTRQMAEREATLNALIRTLDEL